MNKKVPKTAAKKTAVKKTAAKKVAAKKVAAKKVAAKELAAQKVAAKELAAAKIAVRQANNDVKKAKLKARQAKLMAKSISERKAADLAVKNAELLKKFVPKKEGDHLSRGKEFAYLQRIGQNIDQILSLYRKFGIKQIAIPTIYNAIKIHKAPDFVHKAIKDGQIPASDALKILKPLRKEGRLAEEAPEAYEARIREHLEEIISEREERRVKLEKAGFANDEGQVKFTKMRTMAMVQQSLSSIKDSLSNPRAAAIIEFTKALNDGATVEELLELVRHK